MKTKTEFSKISAGAVLLLITLIGLVACNSGKGDSEKSKDSKEDSEQIAEPPSTDIHTATFLGDMDAINQHIRAGSDLNEREPAMGSTPLITAAVIGKTEVAKALIEAGADVNIQNNQGSTALHTAAFLCRTEIVRLLLDNGADPSLKNIFGSTPLQSVEGPFEMVKPIYEQFNKDLGPLGVKLDFDRIEATRPVIADMLRQSEPLN